MATTATEMTTDRLRSQLLGGTREGPGLLRRVAQQIEYLSMELGPKFRSGSFIATGAIPSGSNESEEGQIEALSELCLGLVDWLGKRTIGSSSPTVRAQLIAYLRRNGITDFDYLLGPNRLERRSKLDGAGLLRRVRNEARVLLQSDSPTEAQVDRAEALERYLVGWLGSCAHDFQPMDTDDARIMVFRCNCGACYTQYAGDETWHQVGG